jgi:intracellular septation protein A
MRVLLSFAPLIVFPFLAGFASLEVGLWGAAAAAILGVGVDRLITRRAVKLLDGGQLILFGVLALYGAMVRPLSNVSSARLVINAGLLAIVLVSILTARPFTLQYAREQVPEQLWNSAGFIATNYRITWAWAGAFGVSVSADLARLFAPAIPHSAESAAGIAALVLAGLFTGWYPRHVCSSARADARL